MAETQVQDTQDSGTWVAGRQNAQNALANYSKPGRGDYSMYTMQWGPIINTHMGYPLKAVPNNAGYEIYVVVGAPTNDPELSGIIETPSPYAVGPQMPNPYLPNPTLPAPRPAWFGGTTYSVDFGVTDDTYTAVSSVSGIKDSKRWAKELARVFGVRLTKK